MSNLLYVGGRCVAGLVLLLMMPIIAPLLVLFVVGETLAVYWAASHSDGTA